MRRLVLLLCVISLVCLPLSTIHAAPDSGKQETPAAKPSKPRHHHDKKGKDQPKDKEAKKAKADKSKAVAAAKGPTKEAKAAKPAAKPAKKPVVVQFTLKGEYPEGAMAPGVFGELQPSLATLIERMDAAAADKSVGAVWLKIEDPAIGRGKIHELRAAIARLRKANKPVYAELTTAGGPQYLLATACGQILMPPSGMLIIPGVRAEVTFYKGLLGQARSAIRRPANGQVQRAPSSR